MRRKFVAGNWKMNGSKASIRRLLDELRSGGASLMCDIAVCPPTIYIPYVNELLQGTKIQIGAQNVADQDGGAYTGEVSSDMLKEYGCRYALVGHSERRALYSESDDLVAKRFAAARRKGIIPILCVGESLAEREAGNTEKVVGRQLDAVIKLEGIESLAQAVLAYEPVWAIGTGKTATPAQAQEVHAFIRSKLAGLSAKIADQLIIQYGGSVKGSNAAELFAMPDIDGGLIGGASLTADEFLAIAKAAS